MKNSERSIPLRKIACRKGLINPRWRSEFALYLLLKSYYPDAEYQYRSEWLGSQSLDIFIPSLQLGVEYQGLQHYEAIELFGGEEALHKQQLRDAEKKKKCFSTGVALIEWSYEIPVTDANAKDLLRKAGFELPRKKHRDVSPYVFPKNGIKKPANLIYQYDIAGHFIRSYKTIKEACSATGIMSISNALYGQKETAGGFIWRRVLESTSTEDIKIEDKESETSTTSRKGKHPVYQLNDAGDIINVFDSVSEAAKALDVNEKSIRLCASGKQNTQRDIVGSIRNNPIMCGVTHTQS